MTDDMLLTAAHFSGVVAAGVAAGAVRKAPSAAVGTAASLPVSMPVPGWVGAPGIKPLPQAVAELEADAIRDALVATGGNKLAASRLLGISRATLYERLPRVQRGLGSIPE